MIAIVYRRWLVMLMLAFVGATSPLRADESTTTKHRKSLDADASDSGSASQKDSETNLPVSLELPVQEKSKGDPENEPQNRFPKAKTDGKLLKDHNLNQNDVYGVLKKFDVENDKGPSLEEVKAAFSPTGKDTSGVQALALLLSTLEAGDLERFAGALGKLREEALTAKMSDGKLREEEKNVLSKIGPALAKGAQVLPRADLKELAKTITGLDSLPARSSAFGLALFSTLPPEIAGPLRAEVDRLRSVALFEKAVLGKQNALALKEAYDAFKGEKKEGHVGALDKLASAGLVDLSTKRGDDLRKDLVSKLGIEEGAPQLEAIDAVAKAAARPRRDLLQDVIPILAKEKQAPLSLTEQAALAEYQRQIAPRFEEFKKISKLKSETEASELKRLAGVLDKYRELDSAKGDAETKTALKALANRGLQNYSSFGDKGEARRALVEMTNSKDETTKRLAGDFLRWFDYASSREGGKGHETAANVLGAKDDPHSDSRRGIGKEMWEAEKKRIETIARVQDQMELRKDPRTGGSYWALRKDANKELVAGFLNEYSNAASFAALNRNSRMFALAQIRVAPDGSLIPPDENQRYYEIALTENAFGKQKGATKLGDKTFDGAGVIRVGRDVDHIMDFLGELGAKKKHNLDVRESWQVSSGKLLDGENKKGRFQLGDRDVDGVTVAAVNYNKEFKRFDNGGSFVFTEREFSGKVKDSDLVSFIPQFGKQRIPGTADGTYKINVDILPEAPAGKHNLYLVFGDRTKDGAADLALEAIQAKDKSAKIVRLHNDNIKFNADKSIDQTALLKTVTASLGKTQIANMGVFAHGTTESKLRPGDVDPSFIVALGQTKPGNYTKRADLPPDATGKNASGKAADRMPLGVFMADNGVGQKNLEAIARIRAEVKALECTFVSCYAGMGGLKGAPDAFGRVVERLTDGFRKPGDTWQPGSVWTSPNLMLVSNNDLGIEWNDDRGIPTVMVQHHHNRWRRPRGIRGVRLL